MATAKTGTTGMPVLAEKVREQLVSAVKNGQQLALDALRIWVKAVPALPVPVNPLAPEESA